MKVQRGVFDTLCLAHGLPEPLAEYQFAPPRKWRCDWAWPDANRPVALEIEGGAWTRGRHTRGGGFLSDMEKYNELACRGWILLRATPDQVTSGAIFELLKRVLPHAKAKGLKPNDANLRRRCI